MSSVPNKTRSEVIKIPSMQRDYSTKDDISFLLRKLALKGKL